MTAFPITNFGGLVLDREVDEVKANEAIDALNVDLDKRGAVRVRDGYTSFVANPATLGAPYSRMMTFYTSLGAQKYLIAGGARYAVSIDNTASVVAYDGTVSTTAWSFARIGAPGRGNEYAYAFGRGSSGPTVARRSTGGGWSATTATLGCYATVSNTDNRLVVANTTASESRVAFSDAGVPETFGANNYVDLRPADGEEILAVVSYENNIIAFKQTKFFTFYGTSTDASGNPIFNYRASETGIGCDVPNGAVATQRGVFFINRRGIYVTRGGQPELASGAIDPVFTGSASSFFASGVLNQAQISKCTIGWYGERLYFSYPSGSATTNDRTFVYDPETEQWTLWNVPAGAFAPFRVGNTDDLMFADASGGIAVGRMSSTAGTYTTDNGTAIASRYRSGFYTVGNAPDQGAVIRESVLDGIGTPSFSVSAEFATALPTTAGGAKATVTLGTSPAVGQGRHRVAQRGRRFSYQIEATSGVWRVESITQRLRGVRDEGLKTA